MARSLAERLRAHEQQKARLADEADSLATAHGGSVRRVATAGPPAPLSAADRAAE